MRLPSLTSEAVATESTIMEFRGLNLRKIISEGEMNDTKNLTTDMYPVLYQRSGRTIISESVGATSNIIAKNGVLCKISDNKFYYNDVEKGTLTKGNKNMAVLGDRVVIFPDKKFYDITDSKFGSLDYEYTLGKTTLNFSGNTISTAGNGFPFFSGVSVVITGCSKSANNKTVVVTAISSDKKTITFQNAGFATATETENVSLAGSFTFNSSGNMSVTFANNGEYDSLTLYDPSDYIPINELCIGGQASYTDDNSSGNNATGFTTIKDYSQSGSDKTFYFLGGLWNNFTSGYYSYTFKYKKTYSAGGGVEFSTNSITFGGTLQEGLSVGDAVEITGCTTQAKNNTTATITEISGNIIKFQDETFTAASETGSVKISRKSPELEHICEFNNRIWGTKGNTIYGSKLGDATNFSVFAGVATDSYSLEVGTDGEFTGCCGYIDRLLFFKENRIHILYGNKPANYQMSVSGCQGVQSGCENSIAILKDMLMYKAKSGVMIYSGGVPELIDDKFGVKEFTQAAGGSDGQRYYISMKDAGGEWYFMFYDIKRGLWMREDDTRAEKFINMNEKLCYLNGTDGNVYSIGGETEKNIGWYAEFGETTEFTNMKKNYTRFYINCEPEVGSYIKVGINRDRKGFKTVYSGSFNERKTINIPIFPNRCDIFQLRLEGKGKCRIYSITKEVQVRGNR